MSENFYDSKGNFFMVRCPKCQRENYAPAVSTGKCAWCLFDHNHGKNNKLSKEIIKANRVVSKSVAKRLKTQMGSK